MRSSSIDVLRMICTEDGLYGTDDNKIAVSELTVENPERRKV